MSLGHLKKCIHLLFFRRQPACQQAGLQGQYADTVMQMDFDNS